jgi:hypothetical protein
MLQQSAKITQNFYQSMNSTVFQLNPENNKSKLVVN